jgi:hypothetical protein
VPIEFSQSPSFQYGTEGKIKLGFKEIVCGNMNWIDWVGLECISEIFLYRIMTFRLDGSVC